MTLNDIRFIGLEEFHFRPTGTEQGSQNKTHFGVSEAIHEKRNSPSAIFCLPSPDGKSPQFLFKLTFGPNTPWILGQKERDFCSYRG